MYNETKRREGRQMVLSSRPVDVTASPFLLEEIGLDAILCVEDEANGMKTYKPPKPKIRPAAMRSPSHLAQDSLEGRATPKLVLETGANEFSAGSGSTFLTQMDGEEGRAFTEDKLPIIETVKGSEHGRKGKLLQQQKGGISNSPGSKERRGIGLFPSMTNTTQSLSSPSPPMATRKLRPKHEKVASMLDQVLYCPIPLPE
jgi:hypothetical protein